ncbi:MAG: hypothetical protein ACFE8C_14610 [Promethearchaeota archaeon]
MKFLIKDKSRTDKERGQFLESNCDNANECIKRNSYINKIRKEIMRKTHKRLFKLDDVPG